MLGEGGGALLGDGLDADRAPGAEGRGGEAVASSDPWQASSSSFLALQSKGEERGEGRSRWLVSKSCHFLWPSPEIRYHCSCQDDGLPPQQQPLPAAVCPLLFLQTGF